MRCLFCGVESKDQLCKEHQRRYIWDEEYNWFRKKKRIPKGGRKTKDFKNESKLKIILQEIFGRERVFCSVHPSWVRSPETGRLLEYDFAIPHLKLFIEYNGQQHFEMVPFFHKTREDFLRQRMHDQIKAFFTNDWKLLVFDYRENINYSNVYSTLRKFQCLS